MQCTLIKQLDHAHNKYLLVRPINIYCWHVHVVLHSWRIMGQILANAQNFHVHVRYDFITLVVFFNSRIIRIRIWFIWKLLYSLSTTCCCEVRFQIFWGGRSEAYLPKPKSPCTHLEKWTKHTRLWLKFIKQQILGWTSNNSFGKYLPNYGTCLKKHTCPPNCKIFSKGGLIFSIKFFFALFLLPNSY